MTEHTSVICLAALLILAFCASLNVWGATTSDEANVVLTLTNTPPSIDNVFPPGATDPQQASNKSVTVGFTATDSDGMSELQNTTASVSLVGGTASAQRTSSACTATSINATSINYSCIVQVWYWDAAGAWAINASVNDTANTTGQNTASTLTINTMTAMSLEPNIINFSGMSTGISGASNDPIQLLNEGNTNITTVTANITDLNSTSDIILASAFKMNENDTYAGTALVNETDTTLGWANITTGNSTKENIYVWVNIPSGKTKTAYYSRRNWVLTVS